MFYWDDHESSQQGVEWINFINSVWPAAVVLDFKSWSNSWDKTGFTEHQVYLAKEYRIGIEYV